MSRKISTGRKLSTDMHRKLSAISNCSDISNLSFKLGMDPDDFKSTIQNILGKFRLHFDMGIACVCWQWFDFNKDNYGHKPSAGWEKISQRQYYHRQFVIDYYKSIVFIF